MQIQAEDYLRDPCGASSLPFWKTERLVLPDNMSVLREDSFPAGEPGGRDEPFFKLLHDLRQIPHRTLPPDFQPAACGIEEYAAHINACYTRERVSPEELAACSSHPGYDPSLWLAIRERASRRLVASGIGEIDPRIGEGILEWIQVSPAYRRRGLGQVLVCRLLEHMRGKARFVTVSGRLNSPSQPLALYLSCGFQHPVIWHVLTRD